MEHHNDIPKPNILDIEYYMDSHKKEIVDFIEEKILKIEEKNKQAEPTYEIFDRLVNDLCKDMFFGSTYDTTHILLTNALIFSFGCGWLSQEMINEKEPKFKEEYLEQFGRAITKAYDIGQKYSRQA